MVPSRLLPYLLDPAWFWMLLGTYEDEPIVFDNWQIADLHDYSRIRVREKAPQIGASWLRACEAVWECMMIEDSMTAFVSVDQREASEKVLYARKLYDGLPDIIKEWIPLCRDAVEEVGWGHTARPSRVMSLPNSSAVRGRRMSVVADESDFYKDGGKDTYRAAIGRIARGGRLTMQSTCWGSDTVLDNLMLGRDAYGTEGRKDPVSRASYPWPVVENPDVLASIDMARETLDPADFAEEYECERGLVGSHPYPAQLLRDQTHELGGFEFEDTNKIVVESPMDGLVMGYDVGKGSGRHPSIASLFRKHADGKWRQEALYQPVRRSGAPMQLPEQHEWLVEFMERVRDLHLVVDGQGIGAHIAQALESRFTRRRVTIMIPGSKPPGLPPQSREEMATELKRQLEAAELELMRDLEQAKQFSRTRRDAQGRIVQSGSDKRAHYDRFWATAYAAYGIQRLAKARNAYRNHGLIVIGAA